MTSFYDTPYELSSGNLIAVRASAQNVIGTSVPSVPNTTGARLIPKPDKVRNVRLVSTTPTTVTLECDPSADEFGKGSAYLL